jgi:hypothetical protein
MNVIIFIRDNECFYNIFIVFIKDNIFIVFIKDNECYYF